MSLSRVEVFGVFPCIGVVVLVGVVRDEFGCALGTRICHVSNGFIMLCDIYGLSSLEKVLVSLLMVIFN